MINKFVIWIQTPKGVRLLYSHHTWKTGTLPSLIVTFQRDGSRVLKEDILGLKSWLEAWVDLKYI